MFGPAAFGGAQKAIQTCPVGDNGKAFGGLPGFDRLGSFGDEPTHQPTNFLLPGRFFFTRLKRGLMSRRSRRARGVGYVPFRQTDKRGQNLFEPCS